MDTTLQTIRLEVEVAVREIETSRQELVTKHASMVARDTQLDSMLQYWMRLPGEGATSALALENILTAQDRLLEAEGEYLTAQLTYNLALANHKRAIGVLLQEEQIEITRACNGSVPVQLLHKVELQEPEVAPLESMSIAN